MKKTILTLLIFSFLNITYASDAKFRFISGKVTLNKKPVKKHTLIKYGDTIKTGKNALAVIKIAKATVIKLKANSSITIKAPSKKFNKVTVNKGEAFFKYIRSKAPKRKLRVFAKNTVMGVRGTQFFVALSNKEKNIWMCVNEGKVAVNVNKSKKAQIVSAGEGVLITGNKNPTPKQYKWTKNLNWKMKGSYKEINDTVDLSKINYDETNLLYD